MWGEKSKHPSAGEWISRTCSLQWNMFMGTNYGRVTSRMNFKMRVLSESRQIPNATSCRFRLYEMSKKGQSVGQKAGAWLPGAGVGDE